VSAVPTVAVIDIGSTWIRYGRGTPEGPVGIQAERTQPTTLTDQLITIIAELQEQFSSPLQHVSVSTTGLVDSERGVIVEFDTAENETLRHLPVGPAITDAFDVSTTLENDCTAAALGEATFGKGYHSDTVVHVTFGTGIGAGVVVNGSPIRGERGYAAEVGLTPVVADGELWSTGVRGAWEAYCSGRGIPRFARQLLTETDQPSSLRNQEGIAAPDVFAAADAGDNLAQTCLQRVARYNAAGIGAIVNAYDPGVITLGGSVALQNPEWMRDGIQRHLTDYVLADPPTVTLTDLDEDIELYGGTASFFGTERSTPVMEQVSD
jgi:glucokinase